MNCELLLLFLIIEQFKMSFSFSLIDVDIDSRWLLFGEKLNWNKALNDHLASRHSDQTFPQFRNKKRLVEGEVFLKALFLYISALVRYLDKILFSPLPKMTQLFLWTLVQSFVWGFFCEIIRAFLKQKKLEGMLKNL